jgi:hypothetical protein
MKETCTCSNFDIHDCEPLDALIEIATPEERPLFGIKTSVFHTKCGKPIMALQVVRAYNALPLDERRDLAFLWDPALKQLW